MPFDAADLTPIRSHIADAPPRPRARQLTLGVFSHGGAWKVYAPFDRARAYADRGQALAAAEARAAEAEAAGVRVEVFVQDEDGSLRQLRGAPR